MSKKSNVIDLYRNLGNKGMDSEGEMLVQGKERTKHPLFKVEVG